MKTQHLPKVSVIIPAFNEEKYIIATLEALMKQEYPNYEVIIADNASTDRTAELVRHFISVNDTSVSIRLYYEKKQGTNFARECARKAATGSVIAQIDADCLPPANWLIKGVLALCCFKKRVAVTGPYDYFDGDQIMRSLSLFSQSAFYPSINLLVQKAGRAAIMIGGNAFIRAAVLERAGGYNTSLTFYGDDVDMGKRLARFGYVAFIPSLVQPSSSRRYKANGFWNVNKKYQNCFWDLVWKKEIVLQTSETSHPR